MKLTKFKTILTAVIVISCVALSALEIGHSRVNHLEMTYQHSDLLTHNTHLVY